MKQSAEILAYKRVEGQLQVLAHPGAARREFAEEIGQPIDRSRPSSDAR